MTGIFEIVSVGFMSAFLGASCGLCTASLSKKMGRRADGALTGFTAGLLIAFVCFEILEEGFAAAPLHCGIIGLLAGASAAAFIEGAVSGLDSPSLIGAFAVALHHLPEGIALGGLYAVSRQSGIALAVVIAVHCIPEAAAVFIPLKRNLSPKRFINPLAVCFAISLPMAAGAFLGAALTEISGVFLSFALTFAGGVMLYFTCGEMLPESKRLWRGRLTTLCALAGFILGVVITA